MCRRVGHIIDALVLQEIQLNRAVMFAMPFQRTSSLSEYLCSVTPVASCCFPSKPGLGPMS